MEWLKSSFFLFILFIFAINNVKSSPVAPTVVTKIDKNDTKIANGREKVTGIEGKEWPVKNITTEEIQDLLGDAMNKFEETGKYPKTNRSKSASDRVQEIMDRDRNYNPPSPSFDETKRREVDRFGMNDRERKPYISSSNPRLQERQDPIEYPSRQMDPPTRTTVSPASDDDEIKEDDYNRNMENPGYKMDDSNSNIYANGVTTVETTTTKPMTTWEWVFMILGIICFIPCCICIIWLNIWCRRAMGVPWYYN